MTVRLEHICLHGRTDEIGWYCDKGLGRLRMPPRFRGEHLGSGCAISQTLRPKRWPCLDCDLRQRVQCWGYIKFELSLSSSNRDVR